MAPALAVLIVRLSLVSAARPLLVPVQEMATGTLQLVPSSVPLGQITELGVTQLYTVVEPVASGTIDPGEAQVSGTTFSTHQLALRLIVPVSRLMLRDSRLPFQSAVV